MSSKTDNNKDFSEFKDDQVSEWVKQGVRVLSNTNFEVEVMFKLHAEVDYKKEVSNLLVRSLRFFLFAMLSVIVLSTTMLFGEIFSQFKIDTPTILAIFLSSTVGIVCIGNYRRLISKYTS